MTRAARIAGVSWIVIAAIAACTKEETRATNDRLCTAGAFVYCRCEDREEGTKRCRDDQRSFDDCKCDGSNPPPTEGDGGVTGPLVPVDAGPPPPGAPKLDPKCNGKVGVVAGSKDDTLAYVAAYTGNGTFVVSKSAGPGVRGPVSVLPAHGSLVATYTSRYMLVAWAKMSATTWSAPVSVGYAVTRGATAATLFDGDVRLFYPASDGPYRMGTYKATGWDEATTLVGPVDGGAPLPGASAPAAATQASTIVLGFTGDEGSLGRQSFVSGLWTPVTKQALNAYNVPPALVALEGAGPRDLLMVYVGQDLLLRAMTRDATTKAWGSPYLVDSAAHAIETSLVALPGGGALLAYLGANDTAYFTTWDSSKGFAPPREMLPGKNPQLATVPALARGGCEGDVLVTYAEKAGGVKLLTLAGPDTRGPYDVVGIPTVTWAAAGQIP